MNRPRPLALLVAIAGTGLFALAFLAMAAGSLLQRHGQFSVGVAAMLVVYGALLAGIAWAGWRGHYLARGGMVASAILNGLVAVNLARGGAAPWLWLVALLALATLVGAVAPATFKALTQDDPDPVEPGRGR